MWYHYLALLIAVYSASVTIYDLIFVGNTNGYILNGVNAIMAGIIMYWSFSGIMTPTTFPVIGGRRR